MSNIVLAQTITDYNRISSLANIIWTQHYTPIIGEQQVAYMLEKFQSVAAIEDQVNNGNFYYLLSHNDTYVGYFSFSIDEDLLFLSKLYVLSSARGNGVGRAALTFMATHAKELELKKIKLTVNKLNTNSIKAYEKLGFVNVEAIVQNIGNGFVMDDYVLEKIIK